MCKESNQPGDGVTPVKANDGINGEKMKAIKCMNG